MKIQGTIIENGSKLPIADVNIVLQSSSLNPTQIGTKSDENGNFFLNNSAITSNSIIQISHIGYYTIVIKANLLQGTSIEMTPFMKELPEVVVTAPKKSNNYWGFIGAVLVGLTIRHYYKKSTNVKKIKI